uniref:Uncharacterized protein n=1 Tax=Scleropages formosus TaxID=113540 RepID=A0A8C9SNQ6_SCLFO
VGEHAHLGGEADIPGHSCGDAEQEGEAPDDHAGDAGVGHCTALARAHRVHQGQVAVDASCGLAQKATERPVVASGSDSGPHGQCDEEGEVRHSQVEDEDVGLPGQESLAQCQQNQRAGPGF